MTRKDELEARARDYVSLFVMSGAEPAATKNLTWMLQQVEREVLERTEKFLDEADHMGDVRNWLYDQQKELG